jgi:hypothetical protein
VEGSEALRQFETRKRAQSFDQDAASKRFSQQMPVVAEAAQSDRHAGAAKLMELVANLRSAVVTGYISNATLKSRFPAYGAKTADNESGLLLHENLLLYSEFDACGKCPEKARDKLLAIEAHWHKKCRDKVQDVALKIVQEQTNNVARLAIQQKEEHEKWARSWWSAEFDDMVTHLKTETKNGHTVLLRQAWQEFGGSEEGHNERKKREYLLCKLNEHSEPEERHLFFEESYNRSIVRHTLVARADRLAGSRAAAATARAEDRHSASTRQAQVARLQQQHAESLTPEAIIRQVAATVVQELRRSNSRSEGVRMSADMFESDGSAVASQMLFGIIHATLEGSMDISGMAAERLEDAAHLLASNIKFAATGVPTAWQDAVGLLVRYMNGNGRIIRGLQHMYCSSSPDRAATSAFTAAAQAVNNPYAGFVWVYTTFPKCRLNVLIVDNLDWLSSKSKTGGAGFHIQSRLLVVDLGITHAELREKYGMYIDASGRVVPVTTHPADRTPTRVQVVQEPVGEAKHKPQPLKPRVPYHDIPPDDIVINDPESVRAHRTLEYIICNQGRDGARGQEHDVAMAEMQAPQCGDRIAQIAVPLAPINEDPESEKAVSAAIQTCLDLLKMWPDQESMALSADLGLMATRIAPVVWGDPKLRKCIWLVPGLWHCSLNYLKGMGRQVECSGVDDMVTDAGIFTSATATSSNFINAADRAASRAWNLWAESQIRQAWTYYIDDLQAEVEAAGESAEGRALLVKLARAQAFAKLTPKNPLSDEMTVTNRDRAAMDFEEWVAKRKKQSKMFQFHMENIEGFLGLHSAQGCNEVYNTPWPRGVCQVAARPNAGVVRL